VEPCTRDAVAIPDCQILRFLDIRKNVWDGTHTRLPARLPGDDRVQALLCTLQKKEMHLYAEAAAADQHERELLEEKLITQAFRARREEAVARSRQHRKQREEAKNLRLRAMLQNVDATPFQSAMKNGTKKAQQKGKGAAGERPKKSKSSTTMIPAGPSGYSRLRRGLFHAVTTSARYAKKCPNGSARFDGQWEGSASGIYDRHNVGHY